MCLWTLAPLTLNTRRICRRDFLVCFYSHLFFSLFFFSFLTTSICRFIFLFFSLCLPINYICYVWLVFLPLCVHCQRNNENQVNVVGATFVALLSFRCLLKYPVLEGVYKYSMPVPVGYIFYLLFKIRKNLILALRKEKLY